MLWLSSVRQFVSFQTMIADGLGVRFTVNSLRMQHVCWGSETWYVVGSLARAKKVSTSYVSVFLLYYFTAKAF